MQGSKEGEVQGRWATKRVQSYRLLQVTLFWPCYLEVSYIALFSFLTNLISDSDFTPHTPNNTGNLFVFFSFFSVLLNQTNFSFSSAREG